MPTRTGELYNEPMKLDFCCPFWGSEPMSFPAFLSRALESGYRGIEIKLPSEPNFLSDFQQSLDRHREIDPDFPLVLQCIIDPGSSNLDFYILEIKNKLLELSSYAPLFINSHTGKDYYSFDQNCRILDAMQNLASQKGIRILHETHRGRFSFHAPSLVPYLERFPELELAGDFSHFCTVSESMLEGQEENLRKIIPNVSHIHARIGFEQGPQVNDPQAPEWETHSQLFLGWWKSILLDKKERKWDRFTISPEFGPKPYMPLMPYSLEPLSDQWENNRIMKEIIMKSFHTLLS